MYRDHVVCWKEPNGRSKLIFYATKSFKRLSERISIVVCGVVYPFMCVLWSRCGVFRKLWGDRAFDDLCVCVWCGICSESVCLRLWWTDLAIVWIVLMACVYIHMCTKHTRVVQCGYFNSTWKQVRIYWRPRNFKLIIVRHFLTQISSKRPKWKYQGKNSTEKQNSFHLGDANDST